MPLDVVSSAAFNALIKFDEDMSLTPKSCHLTIINFVNIDTLTTQSMVQQFKSLGVLSASNVGAKSNTSKGSAPVKAKFTVDEMAQVHSMQNGQTRKLTDDIAHGVCCVCSKRKELKHEKKCQHKCCNSCTSEPCKKCGLLQPPHDPTRKSRQVDQASVNCNNQKGAEMPIGDINAPDAFSRRRSSSFSTSNRDNNSAQPVSLNQSRARGDTDDQTMSTVQTVTTGGHLRRSNSVDSGMKKARTEMKKVEDEICAICQDKITDLRRLPCSHAFCKDCIKQAFEHQGEKCPVCGKIFGALQGDQPNGNMKVHTTDVDLEGYPGCGRIVILYDIPDGIQSVILGNLLHAAHCNSK